METSGLDLGLAKWRELCAHCFSLLITNSNSKPAGGWLGHSCLACPICSVDVAVLLLLSRTFIASIRKMVSSTQAWHSTAIAAGLDCRYDLYSNGEESLYYCLLMDG